MQKDVKALTLSNTLIHQIKTVQRFSDLNSEDLFMYTRSLKLTVPLIKLEIYRNGIFRKEMKKE